MTSFLFHAIVLVAIIWVIMRGVPYLYFRWGRRGVIKMLRLSDEEVARVDEYEDKRGIKRTAFLGLKP